MWHTFYLCVCLSKIKPASFCATYDLTVSVCSEFFGGCFIYILFVLFFFFFSCFCFCFCCNGCVCKLRLQNRRWCNSITLQVRRSLEPCATCGNAGQASASARRVDLCFRIAAWMSRLMDTASENNSFGPFLSADLTLSKYLKAKFKKLFSFWS